jgi:hypothetical protein
MLSSMHSLVMTDGDYQRLLDPETTSPLYNFSRALNLSGDPTDQPLQDYRYNGYPSDTFAVWFLRKNPGFVFTMQLIVFSMLFCFAVMSSVLVYITFCQKEQTRADREREY